MKRYAVIVAGGSGNRMNAAVPKQFILLDGKPVLMHSIERFYEADASIEMIVVLPEKEIDSWKELCIKHSFTILHKITEGGETRFHSVKKGLQLVKDKSVIAVHDGVRPLISASLISRCFSAAEKQGNAVPAIPVNESLRKIEGKRNMPADRSVFVLIQTPQCFHSEILKKAYQTNEHTSFTDDASVVESGGESIYLIEGERENIKITYPLDLLIGEAILKKENSGK